MSINTQFELVTHLTEWAYASEKQKTTVERFEMLSREKKLLDTMLVDLHAERAEGREVR